ncbi:MAG: triphosphoribosyl-dephospho-CoA synthase [Candidatus Heimdallarchaeota archaeon]|nr:triphosphoribosyl-dephospho-CoA synthase [Candidatus Heimdallarchaeota archaeon]
MNLKTYYYLTQMYIPNDLNKSRTNFVRMCGELACLLEVSATPKPGNVHRFSDFEDLRYEDFLGSAVSLGYFIEELALKGILLAESKITWDTLKLGKTIKEAISYSNHFHEHGNTNLGIILLLCPLSVAAGLSFKKNDLFCDLASLRSNINKVMEYTTIDDAIYVSEGISSVSPGGLGKVEQYDVTDNKFSKELKDNEVTLVQLMSLCKERDNICLELSQGFPITFETGLDILLQTLKVTQDINLAIINSYIGILAKYPDTLISRKYGIKKAKRISAQAMEIIQVGGALSLEGRRELEGLDIELREEDEKVNPGTTADIVAASIFVYLLINGKFWHVPSP